jgi:hypothetical protein
MPSVHSAASEIDLLPLLHFEVGGLTQMIVVYTTAMETYLS